MEKASAATADERRLHIRYKVSVPATVYSPLGEMAANVNEFSIEGARIRTQSPLFPGTPVKAYLNLDQMVVLVGEVVWVLTCFESDGECFHETGIRIHEIIMPGVKAAGLAARSEILPDILLSIKEAEDFTSTHTA